MKSKPSKVRNQPIESGGLQLLTVAEVADKLSVCRETIRRMARGGLIKTVRFNSRLVRIPQRELTRIQSAAI
jgi:excisionase family DNA binding protein